MAMPHQTLVPKVTSVSKCKPFGKNQTNMSEQDALRQLQALQVPLDRYQFLRKLVEDRPDQYFR